MHIMQNLIKRGHGRPSGADFNLQRGAGPWAAPEKAPPHSRVSPGLRRARHPAGAPPRLVSELGLVHTVRVREGRLVPAPWDPGFSSRWWQEQDQSPVSRVVPPRGADVPEHLQGPSEPRVFVVRGQRSSHQHSSMGGPRRPPPVLSELRGWRASSPAVPGGAAAPTGLHSAVCFSPIEPELGNVIRPRAAAAWMCVSRRPFLGRRPKVQAQGGLGAAAERGRAFLAHALPSLPIPVPPPAVSRVRCSPARGLRARVSWPPVSS